MTRFSTIDGDGERVMIVDCCCMFFPFDLFLASCVEWHSMCLLFFILDGVDDVLALFLWWTFIKEEMLQELPIRRWLQ
jgi:hypothetical protein